MYSYLTFYYFSFLTGSIAIIKATHLSSTDMDQCLDVCSDSFFLLPLEEGSQSKCQRGCRFLNIINLTAKRNLTDTLGECHDSCYQSYETLTSKKSCVVGCDATKIKKQSNRNTFPFLQQYSANEQGLDSLENDFFLDPLIRQQVENGFSIKYKIPEAYIKTLPVNEHFDLVIETSLDPNDKVVCSSLVPFLIFSAVLMVFLLCIVKIAQSIQVIETHVQLVTYPNLEVVDKAADPLIKQI
ncbi:hypothetical protein PPYR_11297 [Photinus pyralis]|uniref:Transmembrane protein 59 n=1 Tax=Photinus pyralis TaxID=7054 RepID=A0A5N4AB22_PHOPY|nr:uncharacterized protein LOC116176316 [Photinus pyralis]KAB0794458.1 hypothetical protein PPYR_11297 [Photinus pyralis]